MRCYFFRQKYGELREKMPGVQRSGGVQRNGELLYVKAGTEHRTAEAYV